MFLISSYEKLSLSKKIYLSTAAGLLIGIFFGDLCVTLGPFNTLFIRMFQITIIPYMVFSILQSIGSLDTETAKIISRKGGIVLVALWGISIFYALCLQISFPDILRAKFFRPDYSVAKSSLDLFDIFIPANPFHAFANGYIPAIVIFSVLLGIAIIHESKKASLIEYSRIMASILKRTNDYIIKLLPLGVLIMSSYTFGTLNLASFKGVLLYLLASLIYLAFMSMVILPGVVTCMTNLKYRKFLDYAMPAALIAFTTGSVFLALPLIYEMMNKFEEEQESFYDNRNKKNSKLANIIVPLAWVVPASYKFLVIFFIVFTHWYYDSATHVFENISLYIGGIPCLFGNSSVIVPFLLNMSDLPSSAYNVFLLTSSFMVYFNNANGAIFIITCTVLCYASITGVLKIVWSKVLIFFILVTLIFAALLYGLNLFMGDLLSGDNAAKEELTHMNLHSYNKDYYSDIDVSYLKMDQYKEIPSLYEGEPLLNKITRTKVLKVGYNPEAPPFSFFNLKKELVGFDIDVVSLLAEELGCDSIEFYEINNLDEYQQCLSKGQIIDMCVGGNLYRGYVIDNMRTSEAYMDLHLAVLIPSKDKNKYADFYSVLKDKSITIGILEGASKRNESTKHMEKDKDSMVKLPTFSDYFKDHKTYALLTSSEIGAAINILYPGYWVLNYKGRDLDLYYAYVFPSTPNADTLREFVNSWIRISFESGKMKERYAYWIMGEAKIQTKPRWSVLSWLELTKQMD
ncbi:MAG TPA: hypothetical protein DD381_10770 [Lentisphaeria bacterium]|nr:MAG: hypothetical protein A2X47_01910 [Lentisphaerae bacterium GWF2_38_69]HBM16809.1 hypothetical protein [Lentisphaeria bacterium]